MDLPVDAYVPGDYVPYEAAKIEIHRRVAGAREVAQLIVLREELEDRFGPVPEPLDNLIRLQDARIKLGRAGARAVDFAGGRLAVAPIELDSRGAKALRERVPEAIYESGRETVRVRAARGARGALPRPWSPRRRRCSRSAPADLPMDLHERRRCVRYPSPPLRPRRSAALTALYAPRHGSMTHASSSLCRRRPRARRRRLAGCGNDVPAGAVAKVGDTAITQDEFDKWLTTAARARPRAARPWSPTRRTTRSASRPRRRRPRRRARADRRTPLKKQCKQRVRPAQARGHAVPDPGPVGPAGGEGARRRRLRRRGPEGVRGPEEAGLPERQGVPEFLEELGHDRGGHPLPRQARPAPEKLTQKVTEEAKKVSDADVEEYYEKNKKRFAQPERRDLQVVLTKTEAKAEQAKKALEGGQTFKDVAKKYSIDEASKSQGGKLPGGGQGPAGEGARRGRLRREEGQGHGARQDPVRLVRLPGTKVTPASQQSLEQAKDTIKNLLESQRQQKALDDFIKDFREEYKDETELRRGLPRRRVQERAEGGDRHRRGLGRHPGRRSRSSRAAAHARRRTPTPAGRSSRTLVAERARRRPRAAGRDHAPAAARVPMGPRAGRALDRAAHRRGGVRAGRRRPLRRRREAARRARRRAVPGLLPGAAARGARAGEPRRGGRRTAARS